MNSTIIKILCMTQDHGKTY